MTFTEGELEYLHTQRLGRLATIAPDGTLQNNPVGFTVDADLGVIDISGRDMGNSRKFHNVEANPNVAFVVDDIVTFTPWEVRCLEIRGTAEVLSDQDPPFPGMSREKIRIHPHRIISWGMGPHHDESSRRSVAHETPRRQS